MSEEQPIYRIVEMAKQVATEQEDTAYQHLTERVATHYQTLLLGGVDRKTARKLTNEFQDYLLCIDGLNIPDESLFNFTVDGDL